MLEKLPSAAYVCDASGLITYFNPRAVELWAREPKLNDATDRYCGSFKLFTRDGAAIPHDQCWMALTLREQRDVSGEEIVIERPDGDRVTALAYASPIWDKAGSMSGALNVLVDISDRTRAHEAQARLAAIIDSSDDAIISKSLDGRILTWNAGAERLFGYSAEEAIDQSIRMIIPPERAADEDEILARIRAGERIGHYETVRIAKDGQRVDVSLTISPIHDRSGRVIGASKVARDITLEKRAREVLHETDRVKDEFLAILAHELRNRLAPIRSAVETLVNHGQIVPESKPALDVVDRQTTQMVRLVEDLLDVSRIARNELPLHKKRVKLQDILREAFEVSRPLIDEREHALTVSEPPRPIYLEADRVRLAQAITNLLNNAARYTDRGGRISLTAERVGDEAVITVRDNGPGVAPEMLPRLFEMFVQVDSSPERSQRGLGVGLTLVKRIVELHGGTIEGRSEGLGKGSEFVVRIPVAKGPRRRRARPSEEAAVAGNGARRILVVDDDRDLANSLAMLLTSMGNEVQTAHDGAEALRIATEFRPDAVALDVSLPTMSGFDVVRQLRQETWGEKIIAIALTGWTQDDVRQRALEVGFDHYVVKPVEAAMLTKLFDGSEPSH
jgi:PAS domain S-box-containing protein